MNNTASILRHRGMFSRCIERRIDEEIRNPILRLRRRSREITVPSFYNSRQTILITNSYDPLILICVKRFLFHRFGEFDNLRLDRISFNVTQVHSSDGPDPSEVDEKELPSVEDSLLVIVPIKRRR